MISKLIAVSFVLLLFPSVNLLDLTDTRSESQLLKACHMNVMYDLANCSVPVLVDS